LRTESKREAPVGSKAHLPSHWTLLPPSLLSSLRNFVQGKKTYQILEVLANSRHPFSNLEKKKKKKKKHKQSPKPMCRLLPNSNVCKKANKHVNQIYTCNFSTPSTTMTRRKRSTSEARNNQSSPNLNVCTQAKKHAKF